MPDVREYQFVVEEAERAARAGEFTRADALLREALDLQEAALGASDPGLASTLNNLAVVCESTGQFEDAERFYRRAYAVASSSLPPTDPLVATSRDNLRDFCAARHLATDDWPGLGQAASRPAPVPAAAASEPVAPAAPAPARAPRVAPAAPPQAVQPAGPAWPASRWAMAALLMAVAVVAVWAWRSAATDRPATADVTASTPAATPSTPADAPAPVTAAPRSGGNAPATATAPMVPIAASPAPAASLPSPVPRPEVPVSGVRVVTADVCRTLSTDGAWRCDALGSPAPPGRAAFYTRIAAPRALRVQHRWYQGTALRQNVTLSIAANPSQGYRTFSRQTLTPGPWRVELRTVDGAVLHEASFEVR